ncbi:MAG: RDD domain protein [Candidatus Nomurabacteria bacterium GW2011_GWA1_46_11]|uniref:RDD domain protein n=1 Tax=Candidatus Nomurabacteria bacterium GW2011_GWA1_46_11 TaxID=1618732 RepID=A0A0G1NN49_9BACT|nr:MAG: RDD domain protein [Microgenomates group bacterium GW2011_GWA2_44_7]KKT77943.1 MAG: RDD domain protein [Microgenomates group bacterium GW2011_GWB1_44_8]KKU21767.1 MAG: RDD domain protein [Candidatus Nomurabacteria bacterium GW2011_GWA1_46_11]
MDASAPSSPLPPVVTASGPANVAPAPAVAANPSGSNNYNYASFGRRLVAAFVDGIIVQIVSVVIVFPIGVFLGVGVGLVAGSSEGAVGLAQFLGGMMGFVVGTVVSILYYVLLIGSRGQTLGKMALGIKVVRIETGSVPGYVTAFLREMVGKFVSTISLLVGFFWMLWDDKKQTFHDKIAGTVVVRV